MKALIVLLAVFALTGCATAHWGIDGYEVTDYTEVRANGGK